MSEVQRFKIRVMRPDEVERVNDLVLALYRHQKMTCVPRVPTGEDAKNELLHEDPATGQLRCNNKGTYVVVACDTTRKSEPGHKDIIGYLIYVQSYSVIRGRCFWLTSFFIEEDYRSHGLGKKMINFIQLHGLKNGCLSMDVGYMNSNLAGQRFYARFDSRNVNEEFQMMMREFDDA